MSILNVLRLVLPFPLSAASCRKCPYRLGLVQCICNPCPACRQGGYKMFTGHAYEKWLFCKCWGLANQQVFLAPNTIVFGAVLFAQQ